MEKEKELIEKNLPINPTSTEGGCPLPMPKSVIIPQMQEAWKQFHTPVWHVMRVSYNRELKVGEYLRTLGFECYTPVIVEVNNFDKDGNRIKIEKSVLPNFLFVRATTDQIYQIKQRLPNDLPLHYYLDRTAEAPTPMTIPDKMMEDFIQEVEHRQEQLLWLDHPTDVFTRGRKVRVIYGPLTGREGFVLRIKRDRRFVLTLNGLCSAAIMNVADFHYDWVEPIE